MMNPNNNNNKNKDAKSLLIDIINRPRKIMKDGDVIDLAKELCIPGWDVAPSKPANIYDNLKVISTDPQSRSNFDYDDIIDELKTPKHNTFETLYKRWKDLNFICNVLDDTVYVESIDKSKFFIIDYNGFTVKSNNDKGVTLNLLTLQVILDTIDYLIDISISDEDNNDEEE